MLRHLPIKLDGGLAVAAMLERGEFRRLCDCARSFGLDVLGEAHSESELGVPDAEGGRGDGDGRLEDLLAVEFNRNVFQLNDLVVFQFRFGSPSVLYYILTGTILANMTLKCNTFR